MWAMTPRVRELASTFRVPAAITLWLLGTLPFLARQVIGGTSKDVEHYMLTANAFLAGARIYTDVPFEYPPYALAWFIGPAALAEDLGEFRILFGLLILAVDAVVKAALLWIGVRERDRPPDFLPFFMYTLATAALGHFLLQRYDVIPAALSCAALLALSGGWTATAGVTIAVAAGTKVYPALLLPVMAAFAWRRGDGSVRRLLLGVAAGLVPLVGVSLLAPWWNFAAVHSRRGLEVGSFWASIVWLGHFVGVPAKWGVVIAWLEVTGPAAAWLAGPARVVWAAATLGSVALATQAAARGRQDDHTGTARLSLLAGLALLPVTTFVAFNLVLSPQFQLWMAPLAAVCLAGRSRVDLLPGTLHVRRACACIFISTFLVPAFFPSPTFDTGLDFGRTMVLLLRNALLLYATWSLARAALSDPPARLASGSPHEPPRHPSP